MDFFLDEERVREEENIRLEGKFTEEEIKKQCLSHIQMEPQALIDFLLCSIKDFGM
jgi:hypothetical protein